jgi:uncharacterized membrane protein
MTGANEETTFVPEVAPASVSLAVSGRRAAWSRLLMPALILALAGMSVVVLARLVEAPGDVRDRLLSQNVFGPRLRREFLVSLLAGAVAPLVVLVVTMVARRRRSEATVQAIERVGEVLAPLMLACFLPALFSVKFSHASPLMYLLVLGIFGLLCQPLLRRSVGALAGGREPVLVTALAARLRGLRRPSPRVLWFGLVVLAAAGYAAYFAFFTIRSHHRLGTTAFDLGIYDNLMFNAIHGHPFRATVLFGPAGGNNLASHAEFGVIWFIPFYALRPGPETMLIAQAIVLGFAAVPLYLFAATQLARPMAAAVALAYLCFPPLHGPNFYDFHWLTLTPFFHFWLFWAIATRRRWLTVAMIIMLYSLREDVAVDLVGLGLFLLLTRIRPRLGLVLAVVSGIWFGIDRFVIMPLAGSWYFQNLYSGLFADGVATFGSVIKTILTNPLFFITTLMTQVKLEYVLHMLAPLAFLPLRRLPLVLLLLPAIFFTIMTTGYSPTTMISFQYTNHWTPFLFLAAVLALVAVARQPNGGSARLAALGTLVIVMAADSYTYGAIFQREAFVGGFNRIEFKISPAEQRRYADLQALVAMIPPAASVAATENETPHISTRKNAYPLRVAPGPVDYLLIGRSHVGDLSRASLNAALANHEEYGLLAQRGDELFLFKRGHFSPATAAATAAARRTLGVP